MLLTLFVSSFLAATLLPGGSEALLIYNLTQQPQMAIALVLVASIGNSLGSFSSYGLGYLGAKKLTATQSTSQSVAMVKRYGVYALLLSWMPLVGDIICVAAGFYKLPILPSAILISLGKTCRYCIITGLFFLS